jgi:transposase-like protein
MARPSKLTPKLRERIAAAVSAGASYKAAAQTTGVGESTLHAWLARGRAERGATRLAVGERPYVRLVDAVEQASARAEVRAAALISKASETDWRAAAWFLERRDPETFGPPRLALEHTGDGFARDTLAELMAELDEAGLAELQELAGRVRR